MKTRNQTVHAIRAISLPRKVLKEATQKARSEGYTFSAWVRQLIRKEMATK
jgi:hypothetical protein